MSERDEVLEMAALHVEELCFGDIGGIAARRKRDRENAEIRVAATEAARRKIGREIRGLKGSRIGDAIENLRILAALIEEGRQMHGFNLVDAWPLAWKGWLDIYATVRCNSNCSPPETRYTIELTDEGREALRLADQPPPHPA